MGRQINQDFSAAQWRFDPDHIRFDCAAVVQAAKRRIDKVIQTGPLCYISSAGCAVALDIADSMCSVLYGPQWARPLEVDEVNGQLLINWPSAYKLHEESIVVFNRKSGSKILFIPIDRLISDSILKTAQQGGEPDGASRRRLP